MSDNIDFRSRNIIGDNWRILHNNKAINSLRSHNILKVYTPHIRASKNMKKKSKIYKGKIDNP